MHILFPTHTHIHTSSSCTVLYILQSSHLANKYIHILSTMSRRGVYGGGYCVPGEMVSELCPEGYNYLHVELMNRKPHEQHTQYARLSHVSTPGDMSDFLVLNNCMLFPYPWWGVCNVYGNDYSGGTCAMIYSGTHSKLDTVGSNDFVLHSKVSLTEGLCCGCSRCNCNTTMLWPYAHANSGSWNHLQLQRTFDGHKNQ